MFTRKKITFAMATALMLSGCGGSSSSGDSNAATNNDGIDFPGPVDNTRSISGRAADGYLMNANVCADLNLNGACDSGEPNTTTTSGGAFELSIDKALTVKQLVVEAIANFTVDEDDGQPVENGFTIVSPLDGNSDSHFVSPLTTMVANEMAKGSGTSLEQANEIVSNRLNTSFDVMDDYVAAANDSSDMAAQQNAQRLHYLAQVSARISGQIESSVTQSDLDRLEMTMADLRSLIDSTISKLLPAVVANIDANLANPSFDIDDFVPTIDDALTPGEGDNSGSGEGTDSGNGSEEGDNAFAKQLFQARLENSAPANPFFEETPQGLRPELDAKIIDLRFSNSAENPSQFYFSGIEDWLQIGEDNGGYISLSKIIAVQGNDGIEPAPDSTGTRNVYLWTDGSQQYASIDRSFLSGKTVTGSATGITATSNNGKIATTAEYRAVDLSLLPTAATLSVMYSDVGALALMDHSGEAIFPNGATAYLRYETFDDDLYITGWNSSGLFGEADNCVPGKPVVDIDRCNVVYGAQSNGDATLPAETLNSLLYANGSSPAVAEATMIPFQQGSDTLYIGLFGSEGDSSGDLGIYNANSQRIAAGSWTREATPFAHMRLNLPDGYNYNASLDPAGGQGYAFLHEYRGYVRAGRFVEAGTEVPAFFNRDPYALQLDKKAANHVISKLNSWGLLTETPEAERYHLDL